MKVFDLIKMIGEILNLPENSVEFSDKNSLGHYVRTPYAFKSNIGRKYIPPMHVDLGQGIIQVIDEILNSSEKLTLTIFEVLKDKNIFIDFDGVIKESLDIKADAFESLFSKFGNDISQKIRKHHDKNSGISRFEKIPLYLEWAGMDASKEKF